MTTGHLPADAVIATGTHEEKQIMTAEAASVLTPPRPTDSRAAMPRIPMQHRRNEHINCGPCGPARKDANQVRDDSVVIDLVVGARNGDKQAWDALVERYAPLIWSICRRHRLGGADADDVGQSVWLRLVDQLDKVRDPAALPGWIATTTRRECVRVFRAAHGPHAAIYALDAEKIADQRAGTAEQELLAAERHAALRQAFTQLPPDSQQLIALLVADPPVPYAEISAKLGIPVGSIGPNRSRCLDKMRRNPAIAALINAESRPSGRSALHLAGPAR
jgi:RNA polymerase sigma factor (sigma-70 family)